MKHNILIIILSTLLVLSLCDTDRQSCTYKQLVDADIIPKFVDNIITEKDLEVIYPEDYPVLCGKFVSFFRTLSKPKIKFDVTDQCKNATLLFVGIPTNIFDPDAIVGYPFLHWLYVNIPPEVIRNGFSGQAGDSVANYFIPLSPTRDHRYTFLVYCQQHYIKTNGSQPGLFDRPSFNVRQFQSNNDLGNPLAINYLNLALTEVQGIDLSGILPIPN